ncbi:Uma2 family endonuclease [Streptomyces sp. LP05-1]|uniref:Uma2 family endonuclease n=1 Tax=Streptomyces pyxinae TaxID=2970734 RepID=A0ABT2CA49_9ACTN|nr:Uma2 family endonuclease [Streptomyces sp. LP05-1]MCS0634280.1 Uma2 family endonuclease [Streptomyces sp. LP05-1]
MTRHESGTTDAAGPRFVPADGPGPARGPAGDAGPACGPVGDSVRDPDHLWPPDDHAWVRPPHRGWVADDLDLLPHLPRKTELIDGALVLLSPQTVLHERTTGLLDRALREQAPEGMKAKRHMTITLDRRNRLDPDVLVVRREALTGPRQVTFHPGEVLLAVEVTAPDTAGRDREVKPLKYARAGIPHHWRVEHDDVRPVVYVHELDPATRAYVPTGVHRDHLRLAVPFGLDIDLGATGRPGRSR